MAAPRPSRSRPRSRSMPAAATITRCARGRLQQLADRLADAIGPFGHRVFTDSAPVLEVELAARSGIGWRGKHTLALDRQAGSMFFLGEIYVDLALPPTPPVEAHCGSCTRLHRHLPDPGDRRPVPARRAALHLLPDDRAEGARFRWSSAPRSATASTAATTASSSARGTSTRSAARSPTSTPGRPLAAPSLLELWAWDEAEFLRRSEGSAIRRIGFERWQRNLAVGLGNALRASGDAAIVAALRARRETLESYGQGAHRLGAGPGARRRAERTIRETRPSTASQSGMLTMPSTVETVTRPATKLPSPPMRAAST